MAKVAVKPPDEPVEVRMVATRSRGKLYVLAAMTILAAYVCYLLILPFIPAIVWAAAAAVITHRLSQWVGRHVKSPDMKAAICTAAVTVSILLPVVGVGFVAIQQITKAVNEVSTGEIDDMIQRRLSRFPQAQEAWNSFKKSLRDPEQARGLVNRLQPGAVAAVSTPIYIGIQLLLMLFILYFLYRDEEHAIASLRAVMPLSNQETDRLLHLVGDTIHATIFGTVVVAMIQGAMGGIMFALMGIPGAMLWAVMMGLFAMVPYLGAFVVWGPVAVYLALHGEWGKAAILATYGACAIGLIDNLLYPYLVGHRLRQHTVMIFFAILGGVNVFGATGLVLGPVILSVTFFLFDLWRKRTAHGASAERP
jgi:predicted PurR-regulated permease PerM